MAIRLECGHNSEWTLRLVDKGQRFRYCIGCIVEKLDLPNLNAPRKTPEVKSEAIIKPAKKTKK
jgi:hypothetical protein